MVVQWERDDVCSKLSQFASGLAGRALATHWRQTDGAYSAAVEKNRFLGWDV